MQEKLAAVDYKNAPYSVKYPTLAAIEANNPFFPIGTTVTRNISLGGKWLELQDNLSDKTVKITDNVVEEKFSSDALGSGRYQLENMLSKRVCEPSHSPGANGVDAERSIASICRLLSANWKGAEWHQMA